MPELFERFTGLPEFVDFRQDQMYDVLNAIQTLKNIREEDPNRVIHLISELQLSRVFRSYRNKYNEGQRDNNDLISRITNVNFTPFKAVIGDDDYV